MSQNRSGTPIPLFRNALESHLKGDPILDAFLGRDKDGFRKIKEIRGKDHWSAPYLIWAILDVDPPIGVYGDLKAIEAIPFQLGAWAKTSDQAWELFEVAEEALDRMDELPELGQYTLLSVLRQGVAPTPEDSEGWIQVVATYRAVLSR